MVGRNLNDIKNPYDYLKHQIKENADRDNLVQEVLVAVLSGFGFNLDKNGATMLALVNPLITPAEILANMIKVGDTSRQLIVLDKDTDKLVLIDPARNQVKNLEALSNTFNNIVIGTTQYTPNAGTYSLRIIKDPTNGVSVGITDSTGTETVLPTKTTTDALRVDVGTLQSKVTALETDNNANKLAIQQNKTATDTNKGNIQANTQGVTKNTGDIAKNTQDIATNTPAIAKNTGDIATNTQGIATNKTGVANNKASIGLLTASAVTELKSADNSVGLTKTSNAQGSITYDLSTASAPVNGVHTLNGMTGNILAEAGDKSMSIVNSTGVNSTGKISYSVSLSPDANNALSLKNNGLFSTAGSGTGGGVTSLNTLKNAVVIKGKNIAPTILAEKNATDNSVELSAIVSPSVSNALSITAGGLFVNSASFSGGGSADDTKETVYFSSTGSDTKSGTLANPVKTIEKAIQLGEAKKTGINDNNFLYIVRKGDSSSDSRNVDSNVITESITNGKIVLDLPQSNLTGDSSLTLHVTKDVDSSNDIFKLNLNGIKKSTIIVGLDVVGSIQDQADQFTCIIDISKIYKSIDESQPNILIKKIDAGNVNQIACVKRLNLFLNNDIIIEEGLTSSGPARTTPIIAVDQTNFGSVEVFIHLNNKSQSTSLVGDYPAVQIRQVEPVQITGTVPTVAPRVSVNINTEKFSSKLFIIADYTPFTTYQISSDYKQYFSSVSIQNLEAQNLILPTSTTRASSIAIGNRDMKFKDSGGGDHTVADKQYVQDELVKFRSATVTLNNNDDAIHMYKPIYIDPISNLITLPTINWNALAGQEYQGSEIDQDFPNFQTVPTTFSYRAEDTTDSSGGVLKRQQWLSEFDGTDPERKKTFFGIAHMLVEASSTISVTEINDPNLILHQLKFSSSKSLQDLKRTFIKGTWLEIADSSTYPKSKYVTAVISGDVVDVGSGSYTLQVTCVFTNSTLQSKMYTLLELNTESSRSLFINPFPSVLSKEAPRYKTIANSNETSIVQNYYLVGFEGASDVLEESVCLIGFSPAYSSLQETDRSDIGKYLFNSSCIQKPIIDKLSSVWGGDKISIGLCPMSIPSHTDSSIYRDLLGGSISTIGDRIEYSYVANYNDPASILYTNNPTEYMGGMKSIAIGSDQNINSGYQLASFADNNNLTIKISATEKDVDLYAFLEGTDVKSIYKSTSFSSLASSMNGDHCIQLDNSHLRNINAIADSPSSDFKTERAVLYSGKKNLSSVTIHVDGFSLPNCIHKVSKNDKILTAGKIPAGGSAVPTADEIVVLQHADSSSGNKGILYKQNGDPSGPLT